MPYDRAISTAGFQPLTTASSIENVGMGHLVADLTLAIGAESLGAGLAGYQGAFGGRPILGMIPGVMPSGVGPYGAGGAFVEGMDYYRTRISALQSKMGTANFAAAYPQATQTIAQLKAGRLDDATAANKNLSFKQLGKKLDAARAGLSDITDSAARTRLENNIKDIQGIRTKMGFGLGLRHLSRAWIINDLFALAFAGSSSLIQGFNSFRYERAGSATPISGTDLDLGSGFADTRASFTQRQRAMQAIHNSQMNTRAAMGNEATFMHV